MGFLLLMDLELERSEKDELQKKRRIGGLYENEV